mmetsp:Transcript_77606/g.240452  ORF Transcript_77606/g.240452 Transcript_77606/m.240452 type:complete len:561 (-) Transcript_77606:33-1715(-)
MPCEWGLAGRQASKQACSPSRRASPTKGVVGACMHACAQSREHARVHARSHAGTHGRMHACMHTSPAEGVVGAQVAGARALLREPGVLAPRLAVLLPALVLRAALRIVPDGRVLAEAGVLHEAVPAAPAAVLAHPRLVARRSRLPPVAIAGLGVPLAPAALVLALAPAAGMRAIPAHPALIPALAEAPALPPVAMLVQVRAEVVGATIPTVHGEDVALREVHALPDLAVAEHVRLLHGDGLCRILPVVPPRTCPSAVVHDRPHVVGEVRRHVAHVLVGLEPLLPPGVGVAQAEPDEFGRLGPRMLVAQPDGVPQLVDCSSDAGAAPGAEVERVGPVGAPADVGVAATATGLVKDHALAGRALLEPDTGLRLPLPHGGHERALCTGVDGGVPGVLHHAAGPELDLAVVRVVRREGPSVWAEHGRVPLLQTAVLLVGVQELVALLAVVVVVAAALLLGLAHHVRGARPLDVVLGRAGRHPELGLHVQLWQGRRPVHFFEVQPRSPGQPASGQGGGNHEGHRERGRADGEEAPGLPQAGRWRRVFQKALGLGFDVPRCHLSSL